jgi:hypothetical protein
VWARFGDSTPRELSAVDRFSTRVFDGSGILSDAKGCALLNASATVDQNNAQPVISDSRRIYERFGLLLLHDHFTIKKDEILLESNDPDARTLHMEVVKRQNLPEGKFTRWRLSGAQSNQVEALTFCGRICY